LLYRQVRGFCTLLNLIDIVGSAPKQIGDVRAVGHRAACDHEFVPAVDRYPAKRIDELLHCNWKHRRQ
jgi:hypothetical protein